MKPRSIAGVSLSVLLMASIIAAEGLRREAQRGTPPRDAASTDPRSAPDGTGSIAGRVVTAGDRAGGPIRRARVTLEGDGLSEAQFADTDTDGRYRFDGLPAGSFRVRVEKPGFLTLEHGAKWPFVQPPPIALQQGQSFTANLALPRGAALEGRIVTETGEPLQRTTVSAVRLAYGPSGRRPVAIGQATTDDRGMYRVHSLPPGEYYVQAVGDRDRALRPLAAGQTRADLALTYYPGTSNLRDARRVSLEVGQEATNLDFAIGLVPVSRATLRVTDSQDRSPATALARLQPAGSIADAARVIWSPQNRGVFDFPAVQPGEYWLLATTTSGDSSAAPEFAASRIIISGDMPNLSVRTMRGAVVDAKIEADAVGGSTPIVYTNLSIVAREVEYSFPVEPGTTRDIHVGVDGHATIGSILGPRIFEVTALPPGWALKGVWLDGREITETAVDLQSSATPRALRLVITNRTASIGGVVADDQRRPLADSRVVAFADDETRWMGPSRFVKSVLAGPDGRFTIDGLLPGTYRVSAIAYLEDGSWNDPDVLRSLKASAQSLDLTAGDKRTLTLSSGGQP